MWFQSLYVKSFIFFVATATQGYPSSRHKLAAFPLLVHSVLCVTPLAENDTSHTYKPTQAQHLANRYRWTVLY